MINARNLNYNPFAKILSSKLAVIFRHLLLSIAEESIGNSITNQTPRNHLEM
jgi:hypothetical protein